MYAISNKKLFLVAALLLLLGSAFAQTSDMTIEVQPDSSLVANYVFDDDGTITVVDIFDTYPDGSYQQYRFEGVYQGQVFSGVSYDVTHTMNFSFGDYDGSITGLGYARQFEFAPIPPHCGNGALEPALGEECEIDSDCGAGYLCDSSCACYSCGNGILQPALGEECEADSDCAPGYACDGSCACYELPPCGNGIVQPALGEDCEADSDCDEFWACSASCACYYPDYCPDGIVQPALGEECEVDSDCGAGYLCDSSCKCYSCGNNIFQPALGEECEFDNNCPESWECNTGSCECYYVNCGNELFEPALGEECEFDTDCAGGLVCGISSCACEAPIKGDVIDGFELVPVISDTNDSFYINVVVDVLDDHPIESGEFLYRFSTSVPYTTVSLDKQGNDYVTVLGPYSGEISLFGEIKINDEFYTYRAQFSNRWFDIIVPSEYACPSVYPVIETSKADEGDVIMFAPTFDAFITISRNVETNELFASSVSDDDDSIGSVTIDVVVDGVNSQYEYTDVVEGDTFITLPDPYDSASYNFSDFDGDRVNFQFLLPFEDYYPPPHCGNGAVEPALGEQCETDSDCSPVESCDNSCACIAPPPCGNGLVEPALGEECEADSDCAPGYACNGSCACYELPPCGNGIVQPALGEECEADSDCDEFWMCNASCACYFPDYCRNGTLEPALGEECEVDSDCGGNATCDAGCACVSPLPTLLTSATIKSRASSDGEKLYLDIEVEKNPAVDDIDAVEFLYSFGIASLDRTLSLSFEGGKYVGTIGPFPGGREHYLYSKVEARDYIVERDETNIDSIDDLGIRWYYLVPVHLVECIEICWDEMDNDGDGLVDEDCIMLPELFFREKDIPEFVVVDSPIEIGLIAKNAGVSAAGPFYVSVYIDGILIDLKSIDGLGVNEEVPLDFSIDSNAWFGVHDLNIILDSGNDVPEMNEKNNLHNQSLIVGYNSFNVILNYNNTYLIGDVRQVKFYDRLGRQADEVDVKITLPDLQDMLLTTDGEGIVEFALAGSGDYIVNASKDRFEPFFGSFAIVPINVDFAK